MQFNEIFNIKLSTVANVDFINIHTIIIFSFKSCWLFGNETVVRIRDFLVLRSLETDNVSESNIAYSFNYLNSYKDKLIPIFSLDIGISPHEYQGQGSDIYESENRKFDDELFDFMPWLLICIDNSSDKYEENDESIVNEEHSGDGVKDVMTIVTPVINFGEDSHYDVECCYENH